MTITIAPLTEREFFAWFPLFSEYAEASGADASDEQVMRVWTAVQAPGALAIVARDGDAVVGFAHALPFDRLLQGDGGYQIEDLYVARSARNRGIGTSLADHVRERAAADGKALLRWATRSGDDAAEALQQRFSSGREVLQTVAVG